MSSRCIAFAYELQQTCFGQHLAKLSAASQIAYYYYRGTYLYLFFCEMNNDLNLEEE